MIFCSRSWGTTLFERNVTLLDDNKALVASGRERDAILHRRCHLIECLGCRIVKMTSVDNEIGLALAEALRDNTSLQIFSLGSDDREKRLREQGFCRAGSKVTMA